MNAPDQHDFPTFQTSAAPTLLPLARILTADQDAAEDLVTTVLASVGRRWHRVGPDPLGYARRLLYREYAGQRVPAPVPDSPDAGPQATGWRAALRRLSPRARVLLVLRYLLRYPDVTTATVLGTSAGAVRHELAEVLDELRRARGQEPQEPAHQPEPGFEHALTSALRRLAADASPTADARSRRGLPAPLAPEAYRGQEAMGGSRGSAPACAHHGREARDAAGEVRRPL